MTNKTEFCGWQPTGNSEDIPKPSKFNRDSLSEEGRVTIPMEEFDKLEKLALLAHTDKLSVEKLQERCDRYEKALTEIDRSRYGMQFRRDRNPNVARQALSEIGGDDDENRL